MKIKRYNNLYEEIKMKVGYIDELDSDDTIHDIIDSDYGILYYENNDFQLWLQLEEDDEIAVYCCDIDGSVSDFDDLLKPWLIKYNEKAFDSHVISFKDIYKKYKELFSEDPNKIKRIIDKKLKPRKFNL